MRYICHSQNSHSRRVLVENVKGRKGDIHHVILKVSWEIWFGEGGERPLLRIMPPSPPQLRKIELCFSGFQARQTLNPGLSMPYSTLIHTFAGLRIRSTFFPNKLWQIHLKKGVEF